MRISVSEHLSFGDENECSHVQDGSVAIVHACKEPCHRRSVGYTTRTIPSDHPHYLVLEVGHHLFLNLIDPEKPLFMMPSFEAFLRFAEWEIAERPLLIHCNQGESRAPSLTLLFMAKRLGTLPNDSYESAATAFRASFRYNPGRGIQAWLANNWNKIS